MLTHRIGPCAEPGCREWSMRRHCETHQTPEETELRSELDTAVVIFADAEEAYVAAVRADDPAEVVATLQTYRRANARLQRVEQGLGMVR